MRRSCVEEDGAGHVRGALLLCSSRHCRRWRRRLHGTQGPRRKLRHSAAAGARLGAGGGACPRGSNRTVSCIASFLGSGAMPGLLRGAVALLPAARALALASAPGGGPTAAAACRCATCSCCLGWRLLPTNATSSSRPPGRRTLPPAATSWAAGGGLGRPTDALEELGGAPGAHNASEGPLDTLRPEPPGDEVRQGALGALGVRWGSRPTG
mmetsp:Transcript_38165/g.106277  ORF Transcript_38165/g.106277 Transcript_38165/m.106277 type:complete len:211 (+) Transcript_38165:110-742(+)